MPRAAPKSAFTPKLQVKNMASMEEFETVGGKGKGRRYSDDYDSESEDSRVPNTLVIKLSPNKQTLNSELLAALRSIPADAVNATVAAVTAPVSKLLTSRSKAEGGWELPSEFTVVCANIDRDPDTYEDSDVAQSFQKGKSVVVSCNALLIVPGKAIIGIVSVER